MFTTESSGRGTAVRVLIGTMTVATLASCASGGGTRFTSTWAAPDAQPVSAAGQRVAVVFMTSREEPRREGERALARAITRRGAVAIPSYTILPQAGDTEQARQDLRRAGADYVLAMRVIGSQTDVNYTPGYWIGSPFYSTLWGFWDNGWGAVYQPGYLETETDVQVETLVYDVARNQLIWAGVSDTIDPSSLDHMLVDVAEQAAKEMEKDGILLTS